ncbi:MAG: hypothetical protein KDH96_07265 [Candidatus Riesia sp.]|nr:hypothetical protein [Candidatus Riesia sp.]
MIRIDILPEDLEKAGSARRLAKYKDAYEYCTTCLIAQTLNRYLNPGFKAHVRVGVIRIQEQERPKTLATAYTNDDIQSIIIAFDNDDTENMLLPRTITLKDFRVLSGAHTLDDLFKKEAFV